jgi:putative inorganic carbon (HCO3(-)) transporter
LILYCFVEVLRRQEFTKDKLQWVTIPLRVVAILSLAMFFLKPEFARFLWEEADDRLGGAFADPMTFAHSFGQFFVFLFGILVFMWQELQKKQKAFLLTTIIVLGLCVLFTFTRGVWIGCAVACLVVAGMFSWRLLLGFSAAGAVGLGLLISFWTAFRERILFVLNSSNNYDSQRIALWKANWAMVQDYPILGTGYGVNSQRLGEYFERLGYPADQFKSHAHNEYLHLWAGTGTLGLLCYLFFVGFLLTQTWLSFKKFQSWEKAVMAGCMAAQVEFLVSGFTESNFERSKVRFVAMMVWALVLVYRSVRLNQSRKNP